MDADVGFQLIVADDNLEPQVRQALRALTTVVSHNHFRVDQSGRLPDRLRKQIFP